MHPDLEKNPMVQAVLTAHSDPSKGLPLLAKMVTQATREGRADDAHVLADSLIGAACRAEKYLGTAEKLARKLVAQQPDKHHLNHLAKVLELRGKKREASGVRRRAARARDEHMTPEIEAAIREAEEAQKNENA